LIGHPYLVRLNPNIPWKTRGNGAVCIKLSTEIPNISKDFSEDIVGGYGPNENIISFCLPNVKEANQAGLPEKNENIDETYFDDILARIEKIILDNASLEDETTNPGIVVTNDLGLPIEIYWSAVHCVLKKEVIIKNLHALDAKFKSIKKGRGIIGASAAIAWASNLIQNKCQLDYTYELISYRHRNRWGSEREVDHEAVISLDHQYKSTFNNYDYLNKHVAITPNSPCPVLFGIRGDDRSELIKGMKILKPSFESIDKWLLFKTNQGTDDHLINSEIGSIEPYTSVMVTGHLKSTPVTIPGGHVLFDLEQNGTNYPNETSKGSLNIITCAAYEPTKEFREIPRALLPGDKVQIFGGVRSTPLTINIEKIRVLELANPSFKIQNPKCPSCGRGMKSMGKGLNSGFRCRRCHTKKEYSEAEFTHPARSIKPGFYEVPVVARRHLSKPLKRFKN
jgi:tRNA(Ile2)-agmatinylcytidine synthase